VGGGGGGGGCSSGKSFTTSFREWGLQDLFTILRREGDRGLSNYGSKWGKENVIAGNESVGH